MRTEWTAVHNVAINMTDDPRAAVRITDLTIAATAACKLSLLVASKQGSVDGALLREALLKIALDPLPQLDPSDSSWDLLARRACDAVRALGKKEGIYDWIASSQESDPARKTRGAAVASILYFRQMDASIFALPKFWQSQNLRLFVVLAASGCFHSWQTDG